MASDAGARASDPELAARYERAVARLVARAEEDVNVLAVVLFGSLAYDTVWQRSDVDLMIITREHKPLPGAKRFVRSLALVEEEVNVHAFVLTRSHFKQLIEGSLQSSPIHSSFARSRLVYSRDDSLRSLWHDVERLGSRDRALQLFQAAVSAVPPLDKAEKYCRVKDDPRYAFLWLSRAYAGLAQIEVYRHGEVADREVLQRAVELNPDFFGPIYLQLIDRPKTRRRLERALAAADAYLSAGIPEVFAPLLDYLAERRTVCSATELESHFERRLGIGGVVTACEWLAEKGVLVKASAPLRLTRTSRATFDELAFLYHPDADDPDALPL
ncbi:MAG: nucleotidyltransferase domain-containing protein [Acidobacteria bacterium]|nr:MAG: nucleotidyltransferase domain-containing protein [Acidobacteriota bacterium]